MHEWLPIRIDLASDIHVIRIAAILDIPPAHAVGLLVEVWGWWSMNSADGHARGVTSVTLSSRFSHPRVLDAMREVGWLEETEDGLAIPGWEKWLSRSAKRREQARRRKRAQRAANAGVTPKSGHMSRTERDIGGTSAGQPAGHSRDKNGTQNKDNDRDRDKRPRAAPSGAQSGAAPPPVAARDEPPPRERLAFDRAAGRTVGITDADLARWAGAYPLVAAQPGGVEAEVRRHDEWVVANPVRTRNRKAWDRSITRWLARAEERATARSGRVPAESPAERAERTLAAAEALNGGVR